MNDHHEQQTARGLRELNIKDTRLHSESSLLSIHESVLTFLHTSGCSDVSDQGRKKRLNELQKRRIFLASEIARVRSCTSLSTQDLCVSSNCCRPEEPGNNSHRTNCKPNFLEKAVDGLNSLFSSEGDTDETESMPQSGLAVSMRNVRKKRKLVAAYRLGGITAAVPHMDPEILSIRFDICLDGLYVACYHAFFDLIVATPTERVIDAEAKLKTEDKKEGSPAKLYLRLSQHTIPSAIPILELYESTMGGSMFPIGGLQDKESWKTEKLKECFQSWCRKAYRACYCWERRKETWNYLQKRKQQRMARPCSPVSVCKGHIQVDSIATTASSAHDQISFDLSTKWCTPIALDAPVTDYSPMSVWEIHLVYEEWMHSLPKHVQVARKQLQQPQSNTADSLTIESHNQPELAQQAQDAFSDHPIEQALELVELALKQG